MFVLGEVGRHYFEKRGVHIDKQFHYTIQNPTLNRARNITEELLELYVNNELDEIHNKMETLLGKDGAYIDGLYYCPHHPHKGYEGERPELKIECECRKPKPGMLMKAAKDFNVDLEKSWMIGDGENDVLAGKNAGCI